MSRTLLLSLHLLAAAFWIGGMAFAHLCLRPAAVSVLAPPQRLPLWAAVLGRFLPRVGLAVLVLLASGQALVMAAGGWAGVPPGWHVMAGVGGAMAVIYLVIQLRLWPRLRDHCAVSAWPEAAAVQDRIRRLVIVNLLLSLVVVGAALWAR
ncbi:MAG: hypothetical protein RLY78_1699 [Pseudomonadota bacterium]|jgi:uncharacterized membrane protein